MKFFPITVVDDFFDYPDQVLELAKSVEYKEPDFSNYPGVISKNKIHEIDRGLFQWSMEKIISLYWDLKFVSINWDVSMDFMKVEPHADKDSILNKGVIHFDSEQVSAAGIVYLGEACRDSGTSFYKKKKEHQFYTLTDSYLNSVRQYHAGVDVPNIEQIFQDHYDVFEETARVQHQHNRMCLYSPEIWHAPTTYGDSTRYTMRFFISYLNCSEQNYPLTRRV